MQIPFVNSKSWAWNKLVDWLIREAKKTPYSHLTETRCIQHWELNDPRFAGSHESVYMERYWLWGLDFHSWMMHWFGMSARLHWIRRPDLDRHLHDHPWPFVSVVLRGNYLEKMPFDSTIHDDVYSGFELSVHQQEEFCQTIHRQTGSVERRRIQDRHAISYVSPGGVWTLFISGKKNQWWGFFVKLNGILAKVYHSDYRHYLDNQRFIPPTDIPAKRSGVDFV